MSRKSVTPRPLTANAVRRQLSSEILTAKREILARAVAGMAQAEPTAQLREILADFEMRWLHAIEVLPSEVRRVA